jgi:hypothetical protein
MARGTYLSIHIIIILGALSPLITIKEMNTKEKIGSLTLGCGAIFMVIGLAINMLPMFCGGLCLMMASFAYLATR